MAENVNVGNWPESTSKEEVAFKLTRLILNSEGKYEHADDASRRPSRDHVLSLYTECLAACGGYPKWKAKS